MSEWIGVHEGMPEETQAYGCTTDVVDVRNSNSGFEALAYLARTTTGERWFTDKGGFELHSVTHWRIRNDHNQRPRTNQRRGDDDAV